MLFLWGRNSQLLNSYIFQKTAQKNLVQARIGEEETKFTGLSLFMIMNVYWEEFNNLDNSLLIISIYLHLFLLNLYKSLKEPRARYTIR